MPWERNTNLAYPLDRWVIASLHVWGLCHLVYAESASGHFHPVKLRLRFLVRVQNEGVCRRFHFMEFENENL